ncbi:cytochrome oxidase small assembly protein [Leptothrix sp. BB-4]
MSNLPDDKRRQNRKLGLILASVALVFFLGFFAKVMLLGK